MTESADYRDGPAAEDFEAAVERRQWHVDAGQHGQRVDRLLALAAPEFSRNHLQSLMEQGHVQLDGQVCTQCSRRAKAGQQIAVDLVPTAQALAFKPEAVPLPIVFEDDHVLVINKPAGLVVHPGAGNWSGTLLNGLLAHHAKAAGLPRAGIVHRLDKGTTGLMVVGKSLQSVTELVRAIAAREVKREYAAMVHGELVPPERRFEGPIGRDPVSRLRMAVVASGKPARTDVKRLFTGQGASAVLCQLHTGRTHQIRVHLSQAGFPLLSDTVYGGRSALGLERPGLHAWRLSFAHPIGGHLLTFEAPFPADFERAWEAIEAG